VEADWLRELAGLISREPAEQVGPDKLASLIRLNAVGPITVRDVERALAFAKDAYDSDDAQSTYSWSTLALALLSIVMNEATGLRGRILAALLRGSGHAKDLEAYGHLARGAAASELADFEIARNELERAREAYSSSRRTEQQTRRVDTRLARLELLMGNWQEAELRAEAAMHRIGPSGNKDDKGQCLLVIGHAQFEMHRLQAASDSVDQILRSSSNSGVLQAQAYLLKAMIETDADELERASTDCLAAMRLFQEAGNERGIRDCMELRSRIEAKRRQA
jgi:tetratricopeptide (TPR) repeat protein